MNPHLSVILPTYNRWPYIEYTLEGLLYQTLPRHLWEIVIVDDGSDDGTEQNIYEWKRTHSQHLTLRCYRLSENCGRAEARNYGAKQSQGNILLFLDAENIPHHDLLYRHYDYHQLDDDKLIISGVSSTYTIYSWLRLEQLFEEFGKPLRKKVLCNPSFFNRLKETMKPNGEQFSMIHHKDIADRNLFQWAIHHKFQSLKNLTVKYGPHLEDTYYPWKCCVTAQLSLKRSFFFNQKGFDPTFRLWGFEDTEFGYRLMNAGGNIYCPDDTIAMHQQHEVNKEMKRKHLIQNLRKFCRKHKEDNDWTFTIYLTHHFNRFKLIEINDVVNEWKKIQKVNSHASSYYRVIRKFLYRWVDGKWEQRMISKKGETRLTEFKKWLKKHKQTYPKMNKVVDRMLKFMEKVKA